MRIAWFTPFNNKSAIGQVSKTICEELIQSCSIEIFSFDKENRIDTIVPVNSIDPGDQWSVSTLDSFDYVVYNMGNFAGNHRLIWQVMQQRPGILIQHDQLMQNFFSQITMFPDYGGNSENGEKQYLSLMKQVYGNEGVEAAKALYPAYFGSERVRLWNSDASLAYPLIDPVLQKSTAVFSHANFFLDKIRDRFLGPTGYSYLPYTKPDLDKETRLPKWFHNDQKLTVVSTGIVHPIKRIDKVAEMLLVNPDIARKINYYVLGDYGGPYGDYLQALSKGPLKGCLHLVGYQPDEIMNYLLDKADFCINLRYPNSEVCSKSLIDQMAFSNPVIVIDSGFFSEIPDNCVVKIRYRHEEEDLERAFRFLVDNPQQRLAIGDEAARFIQTQCTKEVYASRFLDFLTRIEPTNKINQLLQDTISTNRAALKALSFDEDNAPWLISSVTRELSRLFSTPTNEKPDTKKVLGIWFGFPYFVNLRREGITRFLHYMVLALLQNYDITCEVWTYSLNEQDIRIGFSEVLSDPALADRIQIITEKNYQEIFDIPAYEANLPVVVNETIDNLAGIAKKYSEASCFVTAIVYLDNVIGTGKPLFVPVHDLSIHFHYDDFILNHPNYKAHHVDIRSRAENLARAGAFMFSNSEYVRQGQLIKYVTSIDPNNTAVVYLPVNVPNNLGEKIIGELEVRGKFRLSKPYLFYPTQVRPYKNIAVLISALAILREHGLNIDLVLTGNPADVPQVKAAITQYQLEPFVKNLSNVQESELYSLYKYAAAAVVPTLFEGGFPWQACEALFMDTPLVLSNIPVVQERIEYCGMDLDHCGLLLFNPKDPAECAELIEKAIIDPEKTRQDQRDFSDRLLAYSWKNAADHYYSLFFKYGNKRTG